MAAAFKAVLFSLVLGIGVFIISTLVLLAKPKLMSRLNKKSDQDSD